MRSAAARRQGSTMNSLRSALTAVRADPLQPQIRAKEDYECLAANSESEQTVYDVPGTMCIRCSGLDETEIPTEILLVPYRDRLGSGILFVAIVHISRRPAVTP